MMCRITSKKTKRRVGYKILAKKNGKYYSSFTGQEIKVGKVPDSPKYAHRICNNWNHSVDNIKLKNCSLYSSSLSGKTSAYINLADAKSRLITMYSFSIAPGYELVLVKIKFNNITYFGIYGSHDVIASDKIKSIVELKC